MDEVKAAFSTIIKAFTFVPKDKLVEEFTVAVLEWEEQIALLMNCLATDGMRLRYVCTVLALHCWTETFLLKNFDDNEANEVIGIIESVAGNIGLRNYCKVECDMVSASHVDSRLGPFDERPSIRKTLEAVMSLNPHSMQQLPPIGILLEVADVEYEARQVLTSTVMAAYVVLSRLFDEPQLADLAQHSPTCLVNGLAQLPEDLRLIVLDQLPESLRTPFLQSGRAVSVKDHDKILRGHATPDWNWAGRGTPALYYMAEFLNTTKPAKVLNVTEEELAGSASDELLTFPQRWAQRTAGRLAGRALFDFGNHPPLLPERLRSISQTDWTVKVPGVSGGLPPFEFPSASFREWVEFVEACGASLRVFGESEMLRGRVDAVWLFRNRPDPLNVGYAGTLFASGLLATGDAGGGLIELPQVAIFDLLKRGHRLTTVALLIGLGMCHRGTSKAEVERILAVHIRSHPGTPGNVPLPLEAQLAAITGFGLLHYGTGDRQALRTLFRELERRGQVSDRSSVVYPPSYTLASGLAIGWVASCADHRAALTADQMDLLLRLANGDDPMDDPSRCQIPALLALGLAAAGSGDRALAKCIAPSISIERPLHTFYRVLCKLLIEWEEAVIEWDEPSDHHHMNLQSLFGLAACIYYYGLRYAGHGASRLAATVSVMADLDKIEGQQCDNPDAILSRKHRQAVDFCRQAGIMAMSLITAGQAHPTVLSHARRLFPSALDFDAGRATLLSMAVGMACLGAGRCTVSLQTHASLALLLTAILPFWSREASDQSAYFTPWRFLWTASVCKHTHNSPSVSVPSESPWLEAYRRWVVLSQDRLPFYHSD